MKLDETEKIYSAYVKAYDVILPQTTCYQHLMQETTSALEGKKTILDAGIGTGLVSMRLDHPQRKIYGVDIQEQMLQKAQEKIREANAQQRIFLSKQNITSLTFPDSFFDGVVCLNTLYHSYDYVTPLREFARVLKPEGVLVASGPNTNFNTKLFLEKITQEFAEQEKSQQYKPYLDQVIDATLDLSKKMKHFIDAEKMAEVLMKVGFREIITLDNKAYYGNSYFVTAAK